jgi:hypothetical protein
MTNENIHFWDNPNFIKKDLEVEVYPVEYYISNESIKLPLSFLIIVLTDKLKKNDKNEDFVQRSYNDLFYFNYLEIATILNYPTYW